MVARTKPERKQPASAPKRARRSPEEARTLILEAADRVFAAHLPDAVGLKEIARGAGVSHALVTHYFKTYGGLVEAALERRFERLRMTLVGELFSVLDAPSGGAVTAAELLEAYRGAIARAASDPVTVRLGTWAMMSGHAAKDDFFTHRVQGMRFLADALEARTDVSRDDLEFCLIASFALTVVWTVGGTALTGALGRKKTKDAEAAFRARVNAMIDGYLTRAQRVRVAALPSP